MAIIIPSPTATVTSATSGQRRVLRMISIWSSTTRNPRRA